MGKKVKSDKLDYRRCQRIARGKPHNRDGWNLIPSERVKVPFGVSFTLHKIAAANQGDMPIFQLTYDWWEDTRWRSDEFHMKTLLTFFPDGAIRYHPDQGDKYERSYLQAFGPLSFRDDIDWSNGGKESWFTEFGPYEGLMIVPATYMAIWSEAHRGDEAAKAALQDYLTEMREQGELWPDRITFVRSRNRG